VIMVSRDASSSLDTVCREESTVPYELPLSQQMKGSFETSPMRIMSRDLLPLKALCSGCYHIISCWLLRTVRTIVTTSYYRVVAAACCHKKVFKTAKKVRLCTYLGRMQQVIFKCALMYYCVPCGASQHNALGRIAPAVNGALGTQDCAIGL
jgi:hypothetical protein